jgi:1-acyl-sn-glycerol-3-phosphate acyltransferase
MIISAVRLPLLLIWTAFVSTIVLVSVLFRLGDRVFHALARLHARGVLGISGVKVVVEGIERVDFSRSYVYVANHASYFDIPAVVAGIPDQIRIVYKKELEWIPLFGWGLKFGKTYISIDRRKGQRALESLEEAAAKIRSGASVILFGEGTRTSDGRLQPFKRGPFALAVRAGIPVVPVTIIGSYRVLPRHSWRIRTGTIRLVLSEPIPPPNTNDGRDVELDLRNRVERVIAEHYRLEE